MSASDSRASRAARAKALRKRIADLVGRSGKDDDSRETESDRDFVERRTRETGGEREQ